MENQNDIFLIRIIVKFIIYAGFLLSIKRL